MDVKSFIVFYISWITFFYMLYLIIGFEVDSDEYKELHIYISTFIMAWRNSIGDMNTPIYT